jgi:hypothetical protein
MKSSRGAYTGDVGSREMEWFMREPYRDTRPAMVSDFGPIQMPSETNRYSCGFGELAIRTLGDVM